MAELRELKDQLAAVEAQLYLATTTTSDADRQQIVSWLDDLKSEWVTLQEQGVSLTEWTDPPNASPQLLEDDDYYCQVEFKERLVARRDALRALLLKLGVSVAVHWRPTHQGKERPDFAHISAKFTLGRDDSCRYQLGETNGR